MLFSIVIHPIFTAGRTEEVFHLSAIFFKIAHITRIRGDPVYMLGDEVFGSLILV